MRKGKGHCQSYSFLSELENPFNRAHVKLQLNLVDITVAALPPLFLSLKAE